MNVITEKKWFIYLQDHHEGPFSPEEIQEKITQGQLSPRNYIWTDGMQDWKVLDEIFELRVPNQSREKQSLEKELGLRSSNLKSLASETETIKVTQKAQPPSVQLNRKWAFIGIVGMGAIVFALINGGIGKKRFEYLSEALKKSVPAILDQFPFLSHWISPIPNLAEVDTQEYEELKAASKSNLKKVGAQFSLAASQPQSPQPSFYIASNLPDGARFHVYLTGTSETLLYQLTYNTQLEVTLSGKLAKTSLIQAAPGKPIPRGEYTVYLVAAETQPTEVQKYLSSVQSPPTLVPFEIQKDSKILLSKTYFLGGPKDAVYLANLQNYHEKLQAKASAELSELKQYTTTLESQLSTTSLKFSFYKRLKSIPKQRAEWGTFNTQWSQLQTQLDAIFQRWTPESLHSLYFYENLYRLTQQVSQSVNHVHQIHHSYFAKPQDLPTFEIQAGEASSSAQGSLSILKSKISEIEKQPICSNGVPCRDNL